MRLMLLILALACGPSGSDKDAARVDDTGRETGHETGDSGAPHTGETGEEETTPAFAERGCQRDDPAETLPDAGEIDGLRYRVIRIPGGLFEALYAVVLFPADGTTAWEDGAPVVVVAPPGLSVDSGVEEAPKPVFDARYGVVEVQPIYPGWTVAGYSTSGGSDDGGMQTASALSETIRMASGDAILDRGLTLSQIAEMPVCNDRVALLAYGTGGGVAMEALAPNAPLASVLAGFGSFEAPTLPQLVAGDAGFPWMDADPEVDGDGNGASWDDGRNADWTSGACDTVSCSLDYSSVAWDTDLHLSDVFPGRFEDAPQGVLYLDRSGSGALEYDAGGLDVDGDGAIGADEDFVLLPHVSSEGRVYYSPQAAYAAKDLPESWPEGVVELAETEAFWAIRSMAEEGKVVLSTYDTRLPVVVGFTEQDGSLPLPDRPHVVTLHEMFADAGFPTRYNFRGDLLDCWLDPSSRGGWDGGPPRGTDLEEGELDAWAIPESVGDETALALTGLAVLWDAFGPFDYCS